MRDLFATKTNVEFVADFGHAKHFFPDADVFPSVIVVQKPTGNAPVPGDADVCVIPRDAVPAKGLSAAVANASYSLPRSHFTKESWTLEPPEVVGLLDKVRSAGEPLKDFAGVRPLYGIKTGFNEAFLIDAPTRDRLVKDSPACVDIIKPYLRGQDIERWWSPPSDLHMIVLKSSGDYRWPWADATDETQAEHRFKKAYPSLHAHMKKWEEFTDPETGKKRGLRHREDHGRYWWELRPCAYYDAFERPKVLYVDITWSASFSLDLSGRYTNNTGYFIPSGDPWLACVLNAPVGWWFAWRRAQHAKDEALRYFTSFVENYPIPPSRDVAADVNTVAQERRNLRAATTSILDWLRHEFGLERASRTLAEPHTLDADAFVAAVRDTLGRKRKWSAAEIARLKQEHADTLVPARQAADNALALERKLSDMVNTAYGLTMAEVDLMWRTAPPRMPLDTAAEARRLGTAPESPLVAK